MNEKTLKVSPGLYGKVKDLSEKGDISIQAITNDLMSAGLKQFDKLGPIAEHLEENPDIEVREVNGLVYFCEDCQYPLDPEKELPECPNCHTKLSWSEKGKPGTGLGFVGWGLVGLAVLLSLGAQRQTKL